MNFSNNIIDIIFPATACDLKELEAIKNLLENSNLKSNIFYENDLVLNNKIDHEFPSFPAKLRFEQFKKAVENPNSKIIWCAKGGYGSAEILPFLEKLEKPKFKKIFIGFSDISSLNKILIEDWNWQVINAPMLNQIALKKVNEISKNAIFDLIFGKISQLKYQLKLISENFKTSPIKSQIIGGCTSVLCGNFGTKNQINWSDKILFLEDEGEDGERLDRYFQQILSIIIEQKHYPKAILLGNFLQNNPHGTPKEKNIQLAVEIFAKKIKENQLNIPIFEETSKSLGHSENMLPLILGQEGIINKNQLTQNVITN